VGGSQNNSEFDNQLRNQSLWLPVSRLMLEHKCELQVQK